MVGTSLLQRVTLLDPLLPLPQLLPSVVLPAEVRRETGLTDAARRRRRRRGSRRPSQLVAVLQPAPLALPEVHFTKADGASREGTNMWELGYYSSISYL